MPYIRLEKRRELGPLIEKLSFSLGNDGEVNYAITKIIDIHYGKGGYTELNAAMGVLSCAMQEFYRRRCVPFEEEKMRANGDVYGGEQ